MTPRRNFSPADRYRPLTLLPLLLCLAVGCSARLEAPADASGGASAASGGSTPTGGTVPTTAAGGSASNGGRASAQGGRASGGEPVSAGGVSDGRGGASGGAAPGEGVDAASLAKAMGFGVNIGNTLENTATWETGWGQPLVTQAFIDGMAGRGIKTVRVPVAWDTYANNGTIDPAKLARVQQVVAWIEAAGMYAIVNIHWDGGWIFNEKKSNAYRLTEDVKTKFASYWRQIATGFQSVGHQLILEGLNEEARFFINGDPNGQPDIAALNQLNQLFVTTARQQGGYNATRALLIAGFHTDIDKTCVDAFSVPSDVAGKGKLFLSIHYYDPFTFTLMEEPTSWGAPTATWGTDIEKTAVEEQFTKLAQFSARKQIPVIIGEFAVTRGESVVRQPDARSRWMEAVTQASLSRGMVPVLWDTGTDVRRSDGSVSTELQTVLNRVK